VLGGDAALQLLPFSPFESRENVVHELADPDRVEGLDDVADAPELLAQAPVGGVGAGGDEDDRNVLRALVGCQLARDAPAS
jgi:hypothetical protein